MERRSVSRMDSRDAYMTTWRKSSHSGSGTSECVEVARLPEAIAVRDSKAPGAGCLELSPRAFAALLGQLRNDQPFV
ncbi:DUF397 domain-containing protein [Actinomadura sp. NTSP31]|uniref:DUF397 domain-containing protein n=1 Tax=Actinomadura sp. NTSP31 TaxID=1735447 RepID=UPI0035C0E571